MTCTANTSLTPTDMDFIVKGDTLSFRYTFKTKDGVPVSVSGATMTFWLKLDVHSPDGALGDLIDSVVFPDNVDSENGLGFQTIFPVKTESLTSCRTYNYRFTIDIGNNQVYTMGLGRVQVIE